ERIENRLNTIIIEKKREAAKELPDIDFLLNEQEKLQKNLIETINLIEKINEQIYFSNNLIRECTEYLRDLPDAEGLENERKELISNLKTIEEYKDEKLNELRNFIREYFVYFNLFSSIKYTLEKIEEKKRNNQLPPNIDKNFLKEILSSQKCLICNSYLTNEGKENIEKILRELEVSNEVSHILIEMYTSLKNIIEKIKNYPREKNKILKELNYFENQIESIQKRINDIDKILAGYNIQEISEKQKIRLENEKLVKENIRKKAVQEMYKTKLENEINKIKEKIDEALKKEQKVKHLQQSISLSEKVLNMAKNLKNEIMIENKNKIQRLTEELFLSMVWKKNTFKEVVLDDNYNLGLTHIEGYECLGSCSAAERALLALSFTLALHKISGFTSPLIIDTPVARISDQNRKNFANVLVSISTEKQIILLFTPDEYSEQVKQFFDPICCTKRYLNTTNERTTIVME
ncbi:hypothetical protein, partial [Carboxydocella sp. JDF658]|uniref:hypothetical protein n=1 Tax=Carboxydocella sp. JDF658 TaxID=1926600 RepID=UPI0009ACDBF7